MLAETALRNFLLDHTSDQVAQRILPKLIPQDTGLPAIAYQRISTAPVPRRGATSQENIRFQLTIVATTHLSARLLAETIKTAINNFTPNASGIISLAWTNDSDQPRGQTTGNQPVRIDVLMQFCKGATE